MSNDELHNPTSEGANGVGGAADDRDDALLDRVTAAVRDTPVPDGPDEQLLAGTVSALLAAQAAAAAQAPGPLREVRRSQSPNNNIPRRYPTMKTLIKFAAAACVAVIAGLVFLTAPSRNALAFAEVLEQVRQAKSVRFKSVNDVQVPDGKRQTVESTTTILGNRMRQEVLGSVSVFDFERGEVLSLQPKEKQGMRMTMKNLPEQVKSMNLMQHFRTIKPDQAKDVGTRDFDGRRLHGFRVEQPGMTMTVWADPKLQEPVRIESAFELGPVPRMSSVMTDFQWDVPVDASAMSLDVPPGYTVKSMAVDVSPPTEKDLTDGLRNLAKLNGDKFPASFDIAAMSDVIKGRAPKTAEEGKRFQAEVMPQVFAITRGFGFINAANGEDWHYAGDGVSLDQPGRAVAWYRPKGATTYRVVNADLSVRADVAAGDLPTVDSKKMTPGPSPFPASKPAEQKPVQQAK